MAKVEVEPSVIEAMTKNVNDMSTAQKAYEARIADLEKKLATAEQNSQARIDALKDLLTTIQAQTHATGSYNGIYKSERHAEAVGWYMLGKIFEGHADHGWIAAKAQAWIEKAGFAKSRPVFSKDVADAAAMTSGGAGVGLEWIPSILGTAVFDLMKKGTYGVARPKLRTVPYQNAIPTLLGDIVTYPTSEGHNITESQLTSGQKPITYVEWASLTCWTIQFELLSVAAIGEWLGISLARSIGREEDRSVFTGTGVSADYGITGLVNAIPAGGLVATNNLLIKDLCYDDFLNLQGKLPASLWPFAEFYMSGPMLAAARGAKDKAGRQAIMEIVANGVTSSLFLGKPYNLCDYLPTPQSIQAGKPFLLYGVLSETGWISHLMELQIARDTSIGFKSGLVYFRAIHIKSMGVNADLGSAEAAGAVVGLTLAQAQQAA